MQRKEAAIKAMSEVSGPVVATTLVLLSVFIPAAFLPGITMEITLAKMGCSIKNLEIIPLLPSGECSAYGGTIPPEADKCQKSN